MLTSSRPVVGNGPYTITPPCIEPVGDGFPVPHRRPPSPHSPCLPLEGGGTAIAATEGVSTKTGGYGIASFAAEPQNLDGLRRRRMSSPLRHQPTSDRTCRGGVSLRLGPPAALTVHRTVIHFRGMSLRYSVPSRASHSTSPSHKKDAPADGRGILSYTLISASPW